jgi:hypothetical protein
MTHGHLDQARAAREADARRQLSGAGAASLPRAPWLPPGQPPSAADLVRFAVWRCADIDADAGIDADAVADVVLAGLSLLAAARAEVDQVEAALLFAARAGGLSWPRISQAMGLGSAQAAQQRFDRVSGRVENRGSV